jgi:hypothetical protein
MKIKTALNKKTLEALKKFRTENWDSRVSRSEAYKKLSEVV